MRRWVRQERGRRVGNGRQRFDFRAVDGEVEGDSNWSCSEANSENSVIRKSSYSLRGINARYVVAPGKKPWSGLAPRRDGPLRGTLHGPISPS
jgi:hypothetical protein